MIPSIRSERGGRVPQTVFRKTTAKAEAPSKTASAQLDRVGVLGQKMTLTNTAELEAPRPPSFFSRLWHGIKKVALAIWSGLAAVFGKLFENVLVPIAEKMVSQVVFLLGKAVSAIQTLFGVEPPGRKLTPREIDFLEQIYGNSLDYDAVRIKEGSAGLFQANDRPFVLGNTLYLKARKLNLRQRQSRAFLAHEMVHIWQFQNGGSDYIGDSLLAQAREGGQAYNWKRDIPHTSWVALGAEQQAQFIGDAVAIGYFDKEPKPTWVDKPSGTDYIPYLKRALAAIRRGDGAP